MVVLLWVTSALASPREEFKGSFKCCSPGPQTAEGWGVRGGQPRSGQGFFLLVQRSSFYVTVKSVSPLHVTGLHFPLCRQVREDLSSSGCFPNAGNPEETLR